MSLVVRKDPYARHQSISFPSPSLNLSLVRNLFSWAERLAVTFQQALSPDDIPPLPALTLYLGQDSSFVSIVQKLDRFALETSSRDEPKMTRILEETRGLIAVQIASDRAVQAKIHLLQELRRRALQISQLKDQAFILYFNNGGQEIRQKIDEAMAIAANKTLNSQDQATLDLYWEAAARNPWGPEWHRVLEKGIHNFFCNAMNEAYSSVGSLQHPQIKKQYGWYMQKVLRKSIKEVAKQWMARRNQVKFEGDLAKLNYMILKGKIWWMPLVWHRLKQILEPIICNTDNAVQNLTQQKEAQVQKEIAAHLEELNSPSCCIDPEVIKKEGCPENQLEYRLNANKAQRERCLKKLGELQAWTFEDSLKWARKEWGYDPAELKATLSHETPLDRKVITVLFLTSVIEDSEEGDINLDLTALSDPVAYFAERFKQRDEQALALFDKAT
jgi:hypothetical protein